MGNQPSLPQSLQEHLYFGHAVSDADSTEEVHSPNGADEAVSWRFAPEGVIPTPTRKAGIINSGSIHKRKHSTTGSPSRQSPLVSTPTSPSQTNKKTKRSSPGEAVSAESFSTPSPPPSHQKSPSTPGSGIVIDDSEEDEQENASHNQTSTTPSATIENRQPLPSTAKINDTDEGNQKGDHAMAGSEATDSSDVPPGKEEEDDGISKEDDGVNNAVKPGDDHRLEPSIVVDGEKEQRESDNDVTSASLLPGKPNIAVAAAIPPATLDQSKETSQQEDAPTESFSPMSDKAAADESATNDTIDASTSVTATGVESTDKMSSNLDDKGTGASLTSMVVACSRNETAQQGPEITSNEHIPTSFPSTTVDVASKEKTSIEGQTTTPDSSNECDNGADSTPIESGDDMGATPVPTADVVNERQLPVESTGNEGNSVTSTSVNGQMIHVGAELSQLVQPVEHQQQQVGITEEKSANKRATSDMLIEESEVTNLMPVANHKSVSPSADRLGIAEVTDGDGQAPKQSVSSSTAGSHEDPFDFNEEDEPEPVAKSIKTNNLGNTPLSRKILHEKKTGKKPNERDEEHRLQVDVGSTGQAVPFPVSNKHRTIWGRKRRKKQSNTPSSSQSISITTLTGSQGNLVSYAGSESADPKPSIGLSNKKLEIRGPGRRIPPPVRKPVENEPDAPPHESGSDQTAPQAPSHEKEKSVISDPFEFDADSETSGSHSLSSRKSKMSAAPGKIAHKKNAFDQPSSPDENSTKKINEVSERQSTDIPKKSNVQPQNAVNVQPSSPAENSAKKINAASERQLANTPKKSNVQPQNVVNAKSHTTVGAPLRKDIEETEGNNEGTSNLDLACKSDKSNDKESQQCVETESISSKMQGNESKRETKKARGRKRSLRSGGSVADDDSLIKVPRELQPYNLPGRTDYAIVLGSRLRNRDKEKSDVDIPYMNVSHQNQCHARIAEDGSVLPEGEEGEQCNYCAVGMTNFCHTHRALGEDLSYEDTKMDGRYENDLHRCVSLTSERNKRCAKKALAGKKFCHNHAGHESYVKSSCHAQKRSSKSSGARCVAYADGRCTSKAVDCCVFCPKHILLPPSECVFVDPVDHTTDNNDGMAKTAFAFDAQLASEPIEEWSLADVPMTAQCSHTNHFGDRCCYEALEGRFCRMHSLEEEKSPENGNTGSEMPHHGKGSYQAQEMESRQGPVLDFRCVFLHDKVQCRNQVLPGSVLCQMHRECKLNKTSIFDILKPEGVVVEQKLEKDQGDEDDSSSVSSSRESECSLEEDSTRKSDANDDVGSEEESDSDSSASDSDTSVTSTLSEAQNGMYSHSEFINLWRRAENFIGQTTDEIEDSKRVRAANGRMEKSDTGGQLKAQYGRLLPNAMKKMMKILELGPDDVFLDIGHGIGNTCLHVSFCIGCESRGIEVVAGRHSIAEVFRSQLTMFNREIASSPTVGKIDLRLGQLEDPQHKKFLTDGVTRAYVNNFNGVFADRSTKTGQKYFLDDYVAGLFALMAPGSIMITFHPLSLGLDRRTANELRKRHGMVESENASFFEFEKVFLGKAYKSVKWTKHSGNESEIYVYKYRRLNQQHGKDAVILCSNPACHNAINEIPIKASAQNEEGRFVINHCVCRYSPKNLRRRSGRSNASGSPLSSMDSS